MKKKKKKKKKKVCFSAICVCGNTDGYGHDGYTIHHLGPTTDSCPSCSCSFWLALFLPSLKNLLLLVNTKLIFFVFKLVLKFMYVN